MFDKYILKGYLHLFDAETETGGRVEPEDIALGPDTASYPETTTTRLGDVRSARHCEETKQ